MAETQETGTADPAKNENEALKSISDAMREAAQDAAEDAAKVREKLANVDVGRSLARLAYTTSYMVSYGIVYGSVFIARSIPQDNPIVEGFIDGARAAMDALEEARTAPEESLGVVPATS
ncbi:MAG TPA: hypothetical protein VNL74_01615 [Methylococcus sp.]|nr:hypothetical protein [Methylococcus sp.]